MEWEWYRTGYSLKALLSTCISRTLVTGDIGEIMIFSQRWTILPKRRCWIITEHYYHGCLHTKSQSFLLYFNKKNNSLQSFLFKFCRLFTFLMTSDFWVSMWSQQPIPSNLSTNFTLLPSLNDVQLAKTKKTSATFSINVKPALFEFVI